MSKLQVLHFEVMGIHMCSDLQYVNKVIPLSLVEKVPNSPPYLVGLLNYAGNSIPLCDLAMCLGLKRKTTYSLEIPILLCSSAMQIAGMVVDKIIDLELIEIENLQMNDKFNSDGFFSGVATIGSQLVLVINLEKILNRNLLRDPLNTEKDSVNQIINHYEYE